MADVRSPFPLPSHQRQDPREVERRAAIWLAMGIVLLSAAVAWRGRFEPRVAAGSFGGGDPLLGGERLDPNEASEAELAGVPGLGPKGAAAVVHAREKGPFWQVGDLERVPGIGPSALAEMAVWLDTGNVGPSPDARRIDLNAASPEALDRLPGIGPALAARIVADRAARGPFRSSADLDRVKGIGSAKVAALRGLVLPP
jgi:competence ComEA-like helix-hairpin-helix protein